MTLYMATSKTGEKRHLVDGEDLGRTLCRVRPWLLVRNWKTRELIPFASHWENDSTNDVMADLVERGSEMCEHCFYIHRRRQNRLAPTGEHNDR